MTKIGKFRLLKKKYKKKQWRWVAPPHSLSMVKVKLNYFFLCRNYISNFGKKSL